MLVGTYHCPVEAARGRHPGFPRRRDLACTGSCRARHLARVLLLLLSGQAEATPPAPGLSLSSWLREGSSTLLPRLSLTLLSRTGPPSWGGQTGASQPGSPPGRSTGIGKVQALCWTGRGTCASTASVPNRRTTKTLLLNSSLAAWHVCASSLAAPSASCAPALPGSRPARRALGLCEGPPRRRTPCRSPADLRPHDGAMQALLAGRHPGLAAAAWHWTDRGRPRAVVAGPRGNRRQRCPSLRGDHPESVGPARPASLRRTNAARDGTVAPLSRTSCSGSPLAGASREACSDTASPSGGAAPSAPRRRLPRSASSSLRLPRSLSDGTAHGARFRNGSRTGARPGGRMRAITPVP
eukprot:scaffold148_cov371-Prasinococcus_capsulatus_cf.AAC.14